MRGSIVCSSVIAYFYGSDGIAMIKNIIILNGVSTIMAIIALFLVLLLGKQKKNKKEK